MKSLNNVIISGKCNGFSYTQELACRSVETGSIQPRSHEFSYTYDDITGYVMLPQGQFSMLNVECPLRLDRSRWVREAPAMYMMDNTCEFTMVEMWLLASSLIMKNKLVDDYDVSFQYNSGSGVMDITINGQQYGLTYPILNSLRRTTAFLLSQIDYNVHLQEQLRVQTQESVVAFDNYVNDEAVDLVVPELPQFDDPVSSIVYDPIEEELDVPIVSAVVTTPFLSCVIALDMSNNSMFHYPVLNLYDVYTALNSAVSPFINHLFTGKCHMTIRHYTNGYRMILTGTYSLDAFIHAKTSPHNAVFQSICMCLSIYQYDYGSMLGVQVSGKYGHGDLLLAWCCSLTRDKSILPIKLLQYEIFDTDYASNFMVIQSGVYRNSLTSYQSRCDQQRSRKNVFDYLEKTVFRMSLIDNNSYVRVLGSSLGCASEDFIDPKMTCYPRFRCLEHVQHSRIDHPLIYFRNLVDFYSHLLERYYQTPGVYFVSTSGYLKSIERMRRSAQFMLSWHQSHISDHD